LLFPGCALLLFFSTHVVGLPDGPDDKTQCS